MTSPRPLLVVDLNRLATDGQTDPGLRALHAALEELLGGGAAARVEGGAARLPELEQALAALRARKAELVAQERTLRETVAALEKEVRALADRWVELDRLLGGGDRVLAHIVELHQRVEWYRRSLSYRLGLVATAPLELASRGWRALSALRDPGPDVRDGPR